MTLVMLFAAFMQLYLITSYPPGLPANDLRLGQTITDAHRLLLEPTLPAGDYRPVVGVYDPATGARERAPDGSDSLTLADSITIRWPGGSGQP